MTDRNLSRQGRPRKAKRKSQTIKTEHGNYKKRSDGRYDVDGKYANGKRYRVIRDTEELAQDTLIQNGAKTFDAGSATFSMALDELSSENERKNWSAIVHRIVEGMANYFGMVGSAALGGDKKISGWHSG